MNLNGRCGDGGGGGEGIAPPPPNETLKDSAYQLMREALEHILKALMAINMKRDKIDEEACALVEHITTHKQRVQRLSKRLNHVEQKIDKFEKRKKMLKEKQMEEQRIASCVEKYKEIEKFWKQEFKEMEETWKFLYSEMEEDDKEVEEDELEKRKEKEYEKESWSLSLLENEETLESILLSTPSSTEIILEPFEKKPKKLFSFLNLDSFLSNTNAVVSPPKNRSFKCNKSSSTVSKATSTIHDQLDTALAITTAPSSIISRTAQFLRPFPPILPKPTTCSALTTRPEPTTLRSNSTTRPESTTLRSTLTTRSDPTTLRSSSTSRPEPMTLRSTLKTRPESTTLRSTSTTRPEPTILRSTSTTRPELTILRSTSTTRPEPTTPRCTCNVSTGPATSTSTRKSSRPRVKEASDSAAACCSVSHQLRVSRTPVAVKRREDSGRNLMKAVKEGNVREVWRYLREGVDVNFRNASKWTPLHMAAKKSRANIVGLLLEFGANVHLRTSYGFTALHMAAYSDQEGICTCMLINAGAQLNAQNFSGRTPLHCAAEVGNSVTVKILVLAGANKGIKNNTGRTPLDVSKAECVRNYLC